LPSIIIIIYHNDRTRGTTHKKKKIIKTQSKSKLDRTHKINNTVNFAQSINQSINLDFQSGLGL